MKKIISILLVAVMLFSFAPMSMAYTCKDGEHNVEVWVHDEGSNTHTGYCSICKKYITEKCSGDSNVKTCKTEGTCTICGGKYCADCVLDTTKTVTPVAGENTHTGVCSVCGKTMTEHCSGDDSATCKVQGTCAVCGQKYYAEHELGPDYSYVNGSDKHYRQCEICSAKVEEEHVYTYYTYVNGVKTLVTNYKSDGTNGHYLECILCGYKTSTVTHSYKYSCSTECSVCGYKRTDVKHTYSSDFEQVLSNNVYYHTKKCTVCGENSELEACTGGTATCAKKAVCEICGNEYGTLRSTHNKSEEYRWDETGTTHYFYCLDCGAAIQAENHTFSQWSIDPTDSTKQIRTCTVCGYKESVTRNDRTVNFYSDNTGAKEYADYRLTGVLNGNNIENPGTPINKGYKFMGWWLLDGNGAYNREFDFDTDTIDDNTKLYARWSDYYDIIYLDKDGNEFSGSLQGCPTKYFYSGADVTLVDGSKEGYTFEGWYFSPNYSGDAVTTLKAGTYTDDIKLYAKLEGIEYKVEYVKNNDDATGTMDNSTHVYGTASNLSAVTYELKGHYLSYWSTISDGTGKAFKDQGSVTDLSATGGTVKLYAQWAPNEHDINYYDKGGKVFSGELLDCPRYHYYGEYTILNEPHKAGYTFDGWYTKSGCVGDKITAIEADCDEDTNLYVNWVANDNTIYFVKNLTGASGKMSDVAFKSGDSITLPENKFTKDGYQFLGWSDEYGGDIKYTDKQEDLVFESDNPIVLYAVWGKISKVTLVLNEGKITKGYELESYIEGIGATLPESKYVTKDGYVLEGWYTDSKFSGDPVTVISAKDTGDKTFYAKWKLKTYTVTFNYGSATSSSSSSTSSSSYGTAAVVVNSGTAVTVPSAGLIETDLTGTEVITITATPGSSYYAKIYTDTKTLATSSKGTAVAYTLSADLIKENPTIRIAFSTNPYTGDSFSPILWVIALAAAGAGAAITIVIKKRAYN